MSVAPGRPAAGAPTGTGRTTRWWGGRTLRWRLVAGLLALLLLTFAVVGISTTLALRGFLVDRLDAQLPQLLGPAAGLEQDGVPAPAQGGGPPGRGGRDGRAGGPDDAASGALAVRLVGGEVTGAAPLARGGAGSAPQAVALSEGDQAAVAALRPSSPPGRLTVDGLGDFRVQAFPGRGGDVLVVGLPTRDVEATTARLVRIEVVVFAVAIVLAAAAGAALVALSLRPLRRVAATAGAVAATPMATGEVVMPAGVADADERTEVGQVGAAFNLMLAQVGGALTERHATEERLRRFVADASHELRTPLAAIRGHCELALRRSEEVPPDVAHALDRVHSQSLRMGVLVDDLLLLARLDAGRPLAREGVDLTRLVLDAVSDARAADLPAATTAGTDDAGPAHRWRLELPEDAVTVLGDAGRLHQVLANLLANARIHTPAGTTVTARLEAVAGGGRVEVSVTDDGPGIAPDVVGRVFERFVRADASRTRAHATGAQGSGSSGLGLSIVEAVVTAHGGTVDVTSVPGSTRFSVALPAPAADVLVDRL